MKVKSSQDCVLFCEDEINSKEKVVSEWARPAVYM